MKNKSPFNIIWNALSIPLSALGFLSMSEYLVEFHRYFQNLINAYQMVVYPVFEFLFAWAWFKVPHLFCDYLFVGLLYATSEARVRGFGKFQNLASGEIIEYSSVFRRSFVQKHGVWESILSAFQMLCLTIPTIAVSIIFWPAMLIGMASQIRRTDQNGIIKGATIQVRYLRREGDISVFQYLGAVFVIVAIVLMVNFSLSAMF